jgi:nucleotide-binding universal stress UspA family protein
MLVPVDFSDYSREAIRWAVALSRVFPSRVTLLHMVEEAVFPTVYGVEAAPISTVNLVLDRSKAMLDELGQEFFPADAQPAKDVRIGHAAGGITAFAEENATDLIVLATHGLTGLKRFLMGSVAERVVRFAPCAVFATKAAQKSAGVASNANIVSEHVPAEEGRNAMNAYPRILHPADFSETSDAAFAFAVDLARRHGSELHLLHVAPNFGGDPMHTAYAETLDKKRFYQRMQEEAEARMKAMIAANDAESVRIKRVHTHGHSPAPSILAYAGDQRIDLIVIGTHGRRGLRRFVLGSVAEEVIRGATCDVLAVQDRSRPLVPRRLLVPVDLSASSPSHLEGAARIAARFGAEMDVLHVLPEAPLPAWGVDPDILHEVIAKRRDEAEEELAKLIEPIVKSGTVVRTAIDVGSAGSAIVEAARRLDADLIVMAPYARRIVERFFLGSVTEWVIRHADRPLYITHASVPDDKRSPAFASAQAES